MGMYDPIAGVVKSYGETSFLIRGRQRTNTKNSHGCGKITRISPYCLDQP